MKFETEKVVLVDSSSEYESIVGWGCYPNSEKSIQLYPSPEFLNSLSFIKKFYPLPFGARAKFSKDSYEIVTIGRHSERLAKESSVTNPLKQLQGIKINSTETDHASMPLGIFASKSLSRKTNLGGVGTPPYGANLSCWHSNANLHKKVAFTLAEVLISLGIIGVVAALTIPNVVSNYKKKVVETRLAKLYSVLNQAVELSEEKNGACTTWEWGDINNHRDSAYMEKWWKTYMADYIPNVQTVTKNSVATSSISGNGSYLVYFKDGTALKIEAIPGSYIWVVVYVKPQINTKNFNEGDVYQHDSMVSGRDYFSMFIMPSSKCSFDVNYYDNLSRNELIESCKAPGNLGGTCMKMIKDTGWKIPDDYPIKF